MNTIYSTLVLLFVAALASSRSLISKARSLDTVGPITQVYNDSYAISSQSANGLPSIFSPRMDFDQWRPLTGRGDPLRNDPTYDYEPPVLERVHYWADDGRLEREHNPERKSEVLVLGISSRKPSVTPRQPSSTQLKRTPHRPVPMKYEDYTYKLSEHYPMTILVPPPPPIPGYKPSLFGLPEDKLPQHGSNIKIRISPKLVAKNTTRSPDILTSTYALQEANLIYQSSTTSQNWILDVSETKSPSNVVSSDYAGWGPTTPTNDMINDTQNFIGNDYRETPPPQISFYKPVLPKLPPLHKMTSSTLVLPTFLPTVLPPTVIEESTLGSKTSVTWPVEESTSETITETQDYYQETSTEKSTTLVYRTNPVSNKKPDTRPVGNIFNMLGPMITMPLVNGPERPEDNLYAHASENKQVYQEKPNNIPIDIQTMQTMQPPPPAETSGGLSIKKDHYQTFGNSISNKPSAFTHDPYLHMRFTTPVPTTVPPTISSENLQSTPESPTLPMYLIIQGHSKVKTYSSKPKLSNDNHTINNEIPKPNETNEVKHLHPYKNKSIKKSTIPNITRESKAQNLKSLVDTGVGSIEIQETDVGIKYDVSDGSDVPVEIYKKGIVDSDENNYSSYSNQNSDEKRPKRQLDIEDFIPFDEDTLEEYVYKFLEGKKNETSIAGLIAQAVTSDAAESVDELEDDENSEQDEER